MSRHPLVKLSDGTVLELENCFHFLNKDRVSNADEITYYPAIHPVLSADTIHQYYSILGLVFPKHIEHPDELSIRTKGIKVTKSYGGFYTQLLFRLARIPVETPKAVHSIIELFGYAQQQVPKASALDCACAALVVGCDKLLKADGIYKTSWPADLGGFIGSHAVKFYNPWGGFNLLKDIIKISKKYATQFNSPWQYSGWYLGEYIAGPELISRENYSTSAELPTTAQEQVIFLLTHTEEIVNAN